MAKKNKGNKQYLERLRKIQQIENEINREKKKAVVECAHQNDKGKLKIELVSGANSDMYQCVICKAKFSMAKLDQEEIEHAVQIIHDALQQIRCYSDPEEDGRLVRLLGELDFNVQETGELYDRVVNAYGNESRNKKSKKFRQDDDFGSYGSAGLSFIGGGKR